MPTGYSFNLDGTAIYLTMASIFIADALDKPLSISQQISLLVFMIIASKGAGVTGAGLAVLAGGLQAHRPDLVDGVGLVVGIDRFMSEARALTNFAGNAVATVIIGKWVGEFDQAQATCSTTRNPSTKRRCSTTSSRLRDHHLTPLGQVSASHTTPAPTSPFPWRGRRDRQHDTPRA